jgi:hypothetical protein
MALIAPFTCSHCKQNCCEVVDSSGICSGCRKIIARANEERHMSIRSALTLEARIRMIELELYRLNADKRLAALESRNATY